jgi:Zn-dependent protease
MLRSFIQGQIGLGELLAWLIAVVIAITVHEFAHAKSAESFGDPTPRSMGRVTLNPLAHYDPIGTTLFLIFGFGWAKPVPINPLAMRHPRRDGVLCALWGPLSNFLTAILLAVPVRLGLTGAHTGPTVIIMFACLLLGVFNLIPLGPLDGAHVLEGLLNDRGRARLYAFYARFQSLMLILLVLVLAVPTVNHLVFGVILTPVLLLLRLLAGPQMTFAL